MTQGVKYPALSLLWLRSLVWTGFDPWPWNLHNMHMAKKKKKSPYLALKKALTIILWRIN